MAQQVEQLTRNEQVVRSNRISSSRKDSALCRVFFVLQFKIIGSKAWHRRAPFGNSPKRVVWEWTTVKCIFHNAFFLTVKHSGILRRAAENAVFTGWLNRRAEQRFISGKNGHVWIPVPQRWSHYTPFDWEGKLEKFFRWHVIITHKRKKMQITSSGILKANREGMAVLAVRCV